MATDTFSKFAWTGASGAPIGFADAYPEDRYSAFTADPIHGRTVDPNNPNSYMQEGNLGNEIPVVIQDDSDFIDYGMGSNGWVLDNLGYPGSDDNAATAGHDAPQSPARRRGPDEGHAVPIFQDFPVQGHGQNFYGQSIETTDLAAWMSSNTPAPNTGVYPATAREDTGNWPEPFDSTKVAPLLPVVRDTEHIPMYRMAQDDRPLYRYLAVGAPNTQPSGSVYNPQVPANDYLHNLTPIPAAARTPIDPAASQNILSDAVVEEDSAFVDVGGWQ